jgi:hypothetical protein
MRSEPNSISSAFIIYYGTIILVKIITLPQILIKFLEGAGVKKTNGSLELWIQ